MAALGASAAAPGAKQSYVSLSQETLVKDYKLQIPANLGPRFTEVFVSSKVPLKPDNVQYIAQTALDAAHYYHFLRVHQGNIPPALAARFQKLSADGVTFTIFPAVDGHQVKFPESFQN